MILLRNDRYHDMLSLINFSSVIETRENVNLPSDTNFPYFAALFDPIPVNPNANVVTASATNSLLFVLTEMHRNQVTRVYLLEDTSTLYGSRWIRVVRLADICSYLLELHAHHAVDECN